MTVLYVVNPQMITVARQSRGLTQKDLAKGIGISPGVMSRYESGMRPPTSANLAELARTLDYPVDFFAQKAILEGPGIGEFFHRSRQNLSASALTRAYALAELRRLEASKLLRSWPLTNSSVPEYPVDLFDDDPGKIARSVRAHLKVPNGPIFNMTKVMEAAGSIVVAHEFDTRLLDGFSHRPRMMPSFFHLNSRLPPDRWRWTLAHELGHIVMHFEPMESPGSAERQANSFAGEFLAPAEDIRSSLHNLTFQKLAGLKREWKISMQALVNRASQLGTITGQQKRSMLVRLSKAGYRTREPEVLDPPEEPPEMLFRLAKFHMTELRFTRLEIKDFLTINENDFRTYYHDPEDTLPALTQEGHRVF